MPAGERVIVRGFGLAFVDLLVMLTLGRGGRFVPRGRGDSADGGDSDGGRGLDYIPSGREPVLVIGSRRGVPYRSKLDYRLQGEPAELPRFMATPIADALIASKDRLDFFTDVWPLAAKDVAWGYYTELFSAHSDRTTLPWDEFAARYETATWGTPEFDSLVADAVPDPTDRFDVARLDHPLAGLRFTSHEALQEHLRAHIEGDAARRRDPAFSADLGAFRAFLITVGQVARFSASGKVWVGSKVNDIDGWWFGFFMYFASGPPPGRLDELVALSRAGVEEFVGADLWVRADDATGRFLTGGSSDEQVTDAVGLIEARNARPSVSLSDDAMIQALFARGAVREETVVDERDGSAFNTGRLSVSQPDMRIVDAGGALHPRRHALGANTSRPAAGAFARPRTNAPAFRQNDHVARVVLRELAAVAAQNSAATPAPEGVNS